MATFDYVKCHNIKLYKSIMIMDAKYQYFKKKNHQEIPIMPHVRF